MPLRVRKTGQVRTWADGTWALPVRHGLRQNAYIGTHAISGKQVMDPAEWELPAQG